MPTFLRRLRAWWNGYGPTLRAAAIGLWFFGVAVTALGLYGDKHGWWAAAPFATNLVSSVAGGSFGVPVALLILATLSSQQASMTARREARQFAIRLLGRIADAPQAEFRVESDHRRIDRIISILEHIREFVRSHPNGYQAVGSAAKTPPSPQGSIAAVDRLLQDLPTAIARCSYDCASAWQLFRTEARLRLAEHGLPSVSFEQARHIDEAVEALTSADRNLPADLRIGPIWKQYEDTDTEYLTTNPAWLDDSDSELLKVPPAHSLVSIAVTVESALRAMQTLVVEASAAARDLQSGD